MLTFICLNIKYHLEDLIHLLRSIKIYQLIHLTTKFYVKFKLYTQIYINNSKFIIKSLEFFQLIRSNPARKNNLKTNVLKKYPEPQYKRLSPSFPYGLT